MAIPGAFNFMQWIEDNKESLKPPVNNKAMIVNEDFIIMIVGGPNERLDYHYEPYSEWFYQLKGNMHVNIIEDGKIRKVEIKEGETWMLPPNTSHSPQRPEAGSIGLVVEQVRKADEPEYFQWFCQNCANKVYEVKVNVSDIEEDLPKVYDEFAQTSDEQRTCSNCQTVHPASIQK